MNMTIGQESEHWGFEQKKPFQIWFIDFWIQVKQVKFMIKFLEIGF